jgi:PPOX class probable F420-dependent enzyme
MSIDLNTYTQRRVDDEQVIWLTTVKPDGAPVPTPVWFSWSNGAFLIFSNTDTLKIRNIRANPRVTLNFNGDAFGGNIVVFHGQAVIDPAGASAAETAAYVAKYAEGLKQIGESPETFAVKYATVIRIQPTRVRADE